MVSLQRNLFMCGSVLWDNLPLHRNVEGKYLSSNSFGTNYFFHVSDEADFVQKKNKVLK